MKKLLLFSSAVCLSISVISQTPIIEPLGEAEHKDQYILPDAIVNGCCYSDSVAYFHNIHKHGYFQFCRENPSRYIYTYTEPYTCRCDDVAQLFHTDTLLTICGVSVVLKPSNYYLPSVFKYFFGVGDSLFNIKKGGIIPEDTENLYAYVSYHPFIEIFFDAPINVFGNYFVIFDTPKPSQYADYDNDFNISQIMTDNIAEFSYYNVNFNLVNMYRVLKNNDCTPNKTFHRKNWYKYNRETDITSIEDSCSWEEITDEFEDFYGFYMFPIFAETDSSLECIGCENLTDTTITDSSSIANIVDNYTFIFPNPAKKEINIQCSFRMQALELFNEQGAKVNEWEIDAYHYLLNIENYPKGNYILKIKTKSGTAAKKIIVQ